MNQKGLTLVEVIVSLAIIGIIAVVFLSAFDMGLVRIVHSGNRTQAIDEARDAFYNNPTIISPSTIEVTLPTATGDVKYFISGSYAESEFSVGESSNSKATVKVRSFIPGLTSD